ncbi:hypothetical protein LTR95_008814 [Oleoguttula sp. CCFEE 5521]
MLPSLQPKRPQAQAHPVGQHTSYQQNRATTTTSGSRPRTQLEAMPPNNVAPRSAPGPISLAYNPAITHPVFFTNAWRKPPFSMPGSAAFSPVATGYVFGSTTTRSTTTKL